MKTKRILFWAILLLFIGSSVWWIFYFPYNPERLYRAIPDNAIFVSEHKQLAERWKQVALTPLGRSVFSACDVPPEDINEIVDDPGINELIRKLASENTLIARVPSLGGRNEPALVLASWVGGYGQILRWSAPWLDLDLTRKYFDGGRAAWVLEGDPWKQEPKWSFAIVEGVLLGCCSWDIVGVRHIVRRIENKAVLFPELKKSLMSKTGLANSSGKSLDGGWVRWDETGKGRGEYATFRFDLTFDEALRSIGRLQGDCGLSLSCFPDSVSDNVPEQLELGPWVSDLTRLLGDVPSIMFIAPIGYLEPFASDDNAPIELKMLWQILKPEITDASVAFVAVLGGEYSSSMMVKVPAVMIGVKVKDARRALDMVPGVLDKLNAQYKLSLIPRREIINGSRAIILDTASDNIIENIIFSQENCHRPVVAAMGDWFIVSTSSKSLEKLVTRRKRHAVSDAETLWLKGMKADRAAGYGWINLVSAQQDMRNMKAAYDLSLKIGRRNKRDFETQELLGDVITWITAMRPMEACNLWLNPRKNDFDAKFRLGPVRGRADSGHQR